MMRIIRDSEKMDFPRGTVVTIGAYDGVHLGHQYLIKVTIEESLRLGAESVVVTFDRHPASVVRPGSAPLLLSDAEQKMDFLRDTGVGSVCIITFNESRATETATEFVEEFLVGKLRAKLIVVGEDFHFGFKRQGNVELLSELGNRLGFEVIGAPLKPVSLPGSESGVLSSTRIRRAVAEGQMEEAALCLGRWFELRGIVEPGDSRGGMELGFPTANIELKAEMATPPDGIYAGWVIADSGDSYPAAISLGTRPTYYPRGGSRLLEAHLIDFSGDLYGSKLRVLFGPKIRSQERFANAAELQEKIWDDIEKVRAFCESHSS